MNHVNDTKAYLLSDEWTNANEFDTVYRAVLKNKHSKEVMMLPGSKSTFKTDAQDYAYKFIAVNVGWFIFFIDEQREYR